MNRKMKITRVAIYLLLWIILTFLLLFLYYDANASFLQQFFATLLITSFTSLPAYYAAKVLVPRFLYSKRISTFIWSIVLTALATTLLTYIIGGGIYALVSGKPLFSDISYIIVILPPLFIINCIVIGISSAIQIISDRFGMEQHLHKVENEKVNNELAFLRAQINPHFLFNVLNTIYFQIHKENIEARNSIEKFSEMLRYQLYECNTDMIDITKELAYIENYVSIQKLRMEPGTDLQLKLPDEIGSLKIAPLLILPLVENAFKYISHHKDVSQNKLHISISSEQDSFLVINIFNTLNSPDEKNQLLGSKGLGLKNMERRLELLYPGKHSLTTKRTETTYETTLKIRYDD
jgi:two-component system, LytTR family, sensor kinase